MLTCPQGAEKSALIACAAATDATHEERLRAAMDSGLLDRELRIEVEPYSDGYAAGYTGQAKWFPFSSDTVSHYYLEVFEWESKCPSVQHMESLLRRRIREIIDSGHALEWYQSRRG